MYIIGKSFTRSRHRPWHKYVSMFHLYGRRVRERSSHHVDCVLLISFPLKKKSKLVIHFSLDNFFSGANFNIEKNWISDMKWMWKWKKNYLIYFTIELEWVSQRFFFFIIHWAWLWKLVTWRSELVNTYRFVLLPLMLMTAKESVWLMFLEFHEKLLSFLLLLK